MLQQLYRHLANFFLFSRILRVVLNMLEQLYRHLATFHLFPSNLSCSKYATEAAQVPGNLPLAPKQPQGCYKQAGAAVQGPDDLPLAHIQP